MTGHATTRWPKALLHSLPFMLIVTLLMPFYMLHGAQKRAILADELSQPVASDPALIVTALILLGYLVAALVLLARWRRELPDHYSAIEHRTYQWIGAMLWILGGLWIILLAHCGGILPFVEPAEFEQLPALPAAEVLARVALSACSIRPALCPSSTGPQPPIPLSRGDTSG